MSFGWKHLRRKEQQHFRCPHHRKKPKDLVFLSRLSLNVCKDFKKTMMLPECFFASLFFCVHFQGIPSHLHNSCRVLSYCNQETNNNQANYLTEAAPGQETDTYKETPCVFLGQLLPLFFTSLPTLKPRQDAASESSLEVDSVPEEEIDGRLRPSEHSPPE